MKASVSPRNWGFSSAFSAFSKLSASGPCACIQLCRLAEPGTKPPASASYYPKIRPMNSFIALRWNQGGRKVCSATSQRGGKMTKSTCDVPGIGVGAINTVKIDGSGWSKLTVLMQLKFAMSYLYGA